MYLSTLIEQARSIASHAYAPYSHYPVGACLVLESGAVYEGVNVENASYGGTICAERIAVGAAVTAEGPKMRITHVVVHTLSSPPAAPCGLCLQVLSEFASPDTAVTCANHRGEIRTFTFEQLLPQAFHGTDITPSE